MSIAISTVWFVPTSCCCGLMLTSAIEPGTMVAVGVNVGVDVFVGQIAGQGVGVGAMTICTLPSISDPTGSGVTSVVSSWTFCRCSGVEPTGASARSEIVARSPLPVAPGTLEGSSVTQLKPRTPGFESAFGVAVGPMGVAGTAVGASAIDPWMKQNACRPESNRKGLGAQPPPVRQPCTSYFFSSAGSNATWNSNAARLTVLST